MWTSGGVVVVVGWGLGMEGVRGWGGRWGKMPHRGPIQKNLTNSALLHVFDTLYPDSLLIPSMRQGLQEKNREKEESRQGWMRCIPPARFIIQTGSSVSVF